MHSCCSELGLKAKAKGLNTHHAFAQVEDEHYEFFQPLLRAGTHYLDAGRNATTLRAALAAARADDALSERVGRAGQAFAGARLSKFCGAVFSRWRRPRSVPRVTLRVLPAAAGVTCAATAARRFRMEPWTSCT